MKFIDSLSIRGGILALVGVGGGLGIALLLTALLSLQGFRNDVHEEAGQVARASQALAGVSAAQNAFQAQQRGLNAMMLRSFMSSEFDKGRAEFDAGRRAFAAALDQLEALQRAGLPAAGRIAELRPLADELNRRYDDVLAGNSPGEPKYIQMVDAGIRDADTPLIAALAETFAAIAAASSDSAATAAALADRRFAEAAALVLAVGLAGSAAFLILALAIGRNILGRLGGELAPVVAATRRVADGDLSRTLGSGKAAAHSLVAAIDDMQERLRRLIGEVKLGAETTAGNAQALRQATREVAETNSQQSDSAAMITAAIEELTTAIAVMAESAGSAADATRVTRETAGESGRIIQAAIQEIGNISGEARSSAASMQELQQHTRQISGFAREIKEISEQTNLLSLNAAIEAARAGESGRGFAVVADEVRKLATRTADTTRMIENLVGRLGDAAARSSGAVAATAERSRRGTELAAQAESAIARIEDFCERSAVAAREIVDVLGEQRLAAEQIAQNTERMAQMIERGARAAQSSSTNADEVAALADRLRESTLRFCV
ncbi:methyl-accepting chemotaxis protein [Azonexus fungiphilus]|uniref:methyl-accepting chemotaxis protein n=1 Tax=Azonexus fungiphilus TaxID=146940 RepID=UPI00156B84F5|nr:methyl-accepting chemotaxis protein [Azonexus fungiphilus]